MSASPTVNPPVFSHLPTAHPGLPTQAPSLSPVLSKTSHSPGSESPRLPSQPSLEAHSRAGIEVNGAPPELHESNSRASKMLQEHVSPPALSSAASSEDLENLDDFKDAIDENIMTFFSAMPSR